MPYIEQWERDNIDRGAFPDSPGQLNYAITKICHDYIKNSGLCYATINKVIGVLTCVLQELYRTVAAPYENKKKIENGPISRLDE